MSIEHASVAPVSDEPIVFLAGLIFFALLLFLTQFAIYSTMAYRASRARFREVDLRLTGSAVAFARDTDPPSLPWASIISSGCPSASPSFSIT